MSTYCIHDMLGHAVVLAPHPSAWQLLLFFTHTHPTVENNRCQHESQSKPGTQMVDPEPCKELRRRPQLYVAGIVPY